MRHAGYKRASQDASQQEGATGTSRAKSRVAERGLVQVERERALQALGLFERHRASFFQDVARGGCHHERNPTHIPDISEQGDRLDRGA